MKDLQAERARVLGLLADFVEASVARDEAEASLRGAGKLTDEGRGFSLALRREAVATDALLALPPAHLRTLAAALTAPAPAEDMVGIVRGLLDALTAVEKYALPRLGLMDGHGLPDDLLEKHGPAISAARAALASAPEERP